MGPNTVRFPSDFLWGASISAHQTEGGNTNDWSVWEHANAVRLARESESKFAALVPNWNHIKDEAQNPENYISGRATDHYNRFREDISLAKQLNVKVFRFSVEWSRVEPVEGQFNQDVLDHYVQVLDYILASGLTPMLTLHHRTNPTWIAELGDWSNAKTIKFYLRFVEKILDAIGDRVNFFQPINEPMMSLAGGYLGGVYPPGRKNIFVAFRVFNHLVKAQNKAYEIIKKRLPQAQVGISHAAIYTDADRNWAINYLLVKILDYFANWRMLNRTKYDFIGIQYYTRGVIGFAFNLNPKIINVLQAGPKTDMGWEIYPQGLYYFLKKLARRYPQPVIITENGIPDALDFKREKFIKDHLFWVHKAMDEGVDVRGYVYWSLTDNLEWDKGFWPRFGLIDIDYKTMTRTVRPSAKVFAQIIKDSGFEYTANV